MSHDAEEPVRVVDVGDQKKKAIKRFKRGESGKLSAEVAETISDAVALAQERSGKTVVPVILLYERKPRKRRRLGLFGLRLS